MVKFKTLFAVVLSAALALTATSCASLKKPQAPSLPGAFNASASAQYDSMEISANINCVSYDEIYLVFSSPSQLKVSVSGTDYTISAGTSENIISEENLPSKGFVRLIVTALRSCFFTNTGEPEYDGSYFVYTGSASGMEAKLYVNGAASVPEKIVVSDVSLTINLTDFKAV